MKIRIAIPKLLTDAHSVEGKRVRAIVAPCEAIVGPARFEPGYVVFTIAKAFRNVKANTVNAIALEALMNCLCRLDCLFLKCKPGTIPLYSSGVYYDRTTVWDTTPALYARGYGDCKSLTACRIAELRAQGVPCRPVFRHMSGGNDTMFHILVLLPDGSFEDPSKALGMVAPQENVGS